MKKSALILGSSLGALSGLVLLWAASGWKAHDFEGKCLTCHVTIPEPEARRENLLFVDEMDRLCSACHTVDKTKSHPVNIVPGRELPLAMHLDRQGRLTCATCHDVHKQDKTTDRSEGSGLLWGHVKGRAFCSTCHSPESLGGAWRHQTAIPYAHASGKLIESPSGSLLDRFSTECLSCHDGTFSQSPQAEIRQGLWQHGLGTSHPIGIEYPREGDFTDPAGLPEEIRLFDGRLGCLTCHEVYGQVKNMLVMDNRGSRLCLACHKK